MKQDTQKIARNLSKNASDIKYNEDMKYYAEWKWNCCKLNITHNKFAAEVCTMKEEWIWLKWNFFEHFSSRLFFTQKFSLLFIFKSIYRVPAIFHYMCYSLFAMLWLSWWWNFRWKYIWWWLLKWNTTFEKYSTNCSQ